MTPRATALVKVSLLAAKISFAAQGRKLAAAECDPRRQPRPKCAPHCECGKKRRHFAPRKPACLSRELRKDRDQRTASTDDQAEHDQPPMLREHETPELPR